MTDSQEQSALQRADRLWWLNLVRGVAALLLGLGLLLGFELVFLADRHRAMLTQFIGIYLLVSGIMSLIWGFSNRRRWGLWTAAGILGLLGGIGFLLRPFLEGLMSANVLIIILGIIIVLTGLVHIFGGFKTGEEYGGHWTWSHIGLGVIEVIMGLWIILLPFISFEAARFVLSAWGIIAGVGLITSSLRIHRLARMERAEG